MLFYFQSKFTDWLVIDYIADRISPLHLVGTLMPFNPLRIVCSLVALAVLLGTGCKETTVEDAKRLPESNPPTHPVLTSPQSSESGPNHSLTAIELVQNDSLDGWGITNFGGEGECDVNNGVLKIEMGYPLSGVTLEDDDLPSRDYEIALEARRLQGVDFFCGLTFPVNDSHCTLIVGGWAGVVVGLSCVDEKDASSNETKKLMKFDDNRWYKVRVKVGDSIEAWIDEEKMVDLPIEGHQFSIRGDTILCKPLGICTFETTAEYRNVTLTKFATTTFDASED